MAPENLFAGAYIDRRADARLRGDWLAEARADTDTLYIAMRHSAALTRPATGGGTRVAFLSGSDPRIAEAPGADQMILLGWFDERRCVLVDLGPAGAALQSDESFTELRPLACDLPPAEAGLLAYARALNIWRCNHLFCSRCGTATRAARAGHARQCPGCDLQSFPRIDPAIIVLVHDGERALLGRQAGWPANRYSTIAGFVEPGESLEDAVRREVAEETGINVTAIHYHSSQPWPFPASLMLGFTAQGEPLAPTLHDGELEDARWYSRAELKAGAVLLPPREAISRRLIEHWLEQAD